MGIIELYRENHDKGYKENDAESFGGSKEFNKKKKRSKYRILNILLNIDIIFYITYERLLRTFNS